MPRPFASGSRQAPDPYDQFLEQRGFYRKHTARDSSCLFRSISEQMYDTQLHHLIIRQRCVDYMRKCKSLFQKGIDKDIDEYLDEMSKPKTYGTLMELRAIAYMYRRNVILFEAYNTGTHLIKENNFENVFRVFFTPERHFDTVFTSGFIETAAFCQGVCYEILYKHVFKLPDVMYAVEQMLHGNTLEFVKSKTHYVGPYPRKIVYADGRGFDLDTAEETNCILDNRILCHFHNPNFPQFADNLHHDMHLIEAAQYDNQKITKTLDSLLPEKYISCVQQLLKDGITPFPYKVAKALDPDIYRNIEFDAWSEQRKEQRFKNWYTGGSNLQIGVKCLVKLGSSQSNLYNCHIQDMSPEKGPCLVYIEELAQKHTVPYESLQPLPSELAKPWPLPFRYQKHIDRCPEKIGSNDGKKCRKLNGKSRYRELISTIKKEIYTEDEITSSKEDVSYQLKQFTSIQHYYPQSYEMITMPFNVDHSNNGDNSRQSRRNSANSALSHLTSGTDTKRDSKKEDEKDLDFDSSDHFAAYGHEGYPDSFYAYPYENGVIHAGSHNPFYCMYNSQPFPTPPGPVVPHGVYVQPASSGSQPVSSAYFPTLGTLPPPPPPIFSAMTSTSSNTMTTSNVCRHHTLSALPGRVNFAATRSILPSGDDLPQDIPTLRFFYNLGFDYFQMQKTTEANTTSEKNDAVNRLATDLQTNVKFDKENSIGSSIKLDHNHNANQTNTHHSTKRFSSRYFNSKRNEKHTPRSGASSVANIQRSSHVDLPGKQNNTAVTKNNPAISGSAAIGVSSHSKVSAANTTANNSSEQTIQTSPTSTLITTETWSNDFMNNSPLYSTQAGPMSYSGPCVPLYPDNESQQGVYVQTPTIMTVPYGMYPIPQAPHPGPTFQAYLPPPNSLPMIPPPPPAFQPNPFMASGNISDPTPVVVNADSVDNGSYAFMGYPSIYYSPTSNGNGMPATGTSLQPAYWYPAGPPLTTSVTPAATPNNNATSTPSATSAISVSSR